MSRKIEDGKIQSELKKMAGRKNGVTATELAEKLDVSKNYGQTILTKARDAKLVKELPEKRQPPSGIGRPATAFVLRG